MPGLRQVDFGQGWRCLSHADPIYGNSRVVDTIRCSPHRPTLYRTASRRAFRLAKDTVPVWVSHHGRSHRGRARQALSASPSLMVWQRYRDPLAPIGQEKSVDLRKSCCSCPLYQAHHPMLYDDSASGYCAAACNDWRAGSADSMLARTTTASTSDAGHTTVGVSLTAKT